MAKTRRLLILGGTGEAVELATAAAALPGLELVTSLAGRTRAPHRPEGGLRRGGFGGAAGLAAYLEESRIDLLVDATHPFAARISRHAAEACAARGVPRLMFLRSPWEAAAGDRWIDAADMAAAAALPVLANRIFLAIGRQELEPFAALVDCWFLLRLIEPPEVPLPLTRCELVVGRGPFTIEGETALLREHRIGALVSKNSGGDATYAKLAAARALGLPVVMVRRPPLPAGERVATVEAALAWLSEKLGLEKKLG